MLGCVLAEQWSGIHVVLGRLEAMSSFAWVGFWVRRAAVRNFLHTVSVLRCLCDAYLRTTFLSHRVYSWH